MMYIERIHNAKREWRIDLPPKLCRDLGFQKGDQFFVYAVDDRTIILRRVLSEKIFENNQLLDKINSIDYGK